MPVIDVEGFENCICHHPELVNLYECRIGVGTRIASYVEIGQAEIGMDCKIEAFAFIPPGTVIGDNVFIGPHACICNTKHPMEGEPYDGVRIEDNAVIGANSTILPGVRIGESAVIAAGAVVTKDVNPGTTVKGNPAK